VQQLAQEDRGQDRELRLRAEDDLDKGLRKSGAEQAAEDEALVVLQEVRPGVDFLNRFDLRAKFDHDHICTYCIHILAFNGWSDWINPVIKISMLLRCLCLCIVVFSCNDVVINATKTHVSHLV
jgi:hypothetical protein